MDRFVKSLPNQLLQHDRSFNLVALSEHSTLSSLKAEFGKPCYKQRSVKYETEVYCFRFMAYDLVIKLQVGFREGFVEYVKKTIIGEGQGLDECVTQLKNKYPLLNTSNSLAFLNEQTLNYMNSNNGKVELIQIFDYKSARYRVNKQIEVYHAKKLEEEYRRGLFLDKIA